MACGYGCLLYTSVVYLSMAPKSNALYMAYESAKKDAARMLAEPVPLHLRNAPTKLMQELNYGKGYQYAHDTSDKLTNICLLYTSDPAVPRPV